MARGLIEVVMDDIAETFCAARVKRQINHVERHLDISIDIQTNVLDLGQGQVELEYYIEDESDTFCAVLILLVAILAILSLYWGVLFRAEANLRSIIVLSTSTRQ